SITAGEINQGTTLLYFGFYNFSDHDIVIPGKNAIPHRAFDERQPARQQGHSGPAGNPVDAVEPVALAGSEMIGNLALRFIQNINAEMHTWPEMFQNSGSVSNADQHQRRQKRYGGKGIHGNAVGLAVAVEYRSHSHTRRIPAAGQPELPFA